MLETALLYAARGWPVFPCHSIKDGYCTCSRKNCKSPGKHPRTSHGRNTATTDEQTIKNWWSIWPDANIAIATGKESGLVVLDIDDGGEDFVSMKYVPDTVEAITGGGGRHILFNRPDEEIRFLTKTHLFGEPIDSRADGGYIIAPPSIHKSGRSYEWEGSSDPLEGHPIADAPLWFLDEIRGQGLSDAAISPPEWNPDGFLPYNILDMLTAIPADNYTIWRDVGMAIHYTDPEDGYSVFDWWSSTSFKYDAEAVRREWRNWSRRGHAVSNPVTVDTIRRIAVEHGWNDPDIDHGAEVAAVFLNAHKKKIKIALARKPRMSKPLPPDNIIPNSGLIGDIARWILKTSVRAQPKLAVAAAASFVGAIAGRKYASPTNLRTNLYFVGLAKSGAGKDRARSAIQQLAVYAGVQDYLGADRIASGSAIASNLAIQPAKVYMLDEFGLSLQAVTNNKASSHQKDIISMLLTLYSQAGGVFLGTEYADTKNNQRRVIYNPHVCLYGTSTPVQFWAALTSAHALDGTLNRMLVIDAGDERPVPARNMEITPPPPELVDRIRALADFTPGGGNIKNAGGEIDAIEPLKVPVDNLVADAMYQFQLEMDAAGTCQASEAIYSRVHENAIKLALTYAVSVNFEAPRIDADAWEWAQGVALWCAQTLFHQAGRYIADSEIEGEHKKVLNMIQDAGSNGMTRRDLTRRMQNIRKQLREEIVQTLIEAGQIESLSTKKAHGPAKITYYALDITQ